MSEDNTAKEEVNRDSIYSSSSAIDSKHSNLSNYRKLWAHALAISKLTGLKTYYAKVDNDHSYKALLSLGAEDILTEAKSDPYKVVYVDLAGLSSQTLRRKSIFPKL